MAINFSGAVTAYGQLITNFKKTISRTPAVKTENPLTGEETLTDGTTVSIIGTLFKRGDKYTQDRPGLIANADAVVMVKPTVTINKNDKLAYGGETYRVEEVEGRYYDETLIYYAAQCFKI